MTFPWCDICNCEIECETEFDFGEHLRSVHEGENPASNRFEIEELRTALVDCIITDVGPLNHGEGGICVLYLKTPDGILKRVFLRRSLSWWFTEAAV